MQLAQPAFADARGTTGIEERLRVALDPQFELERAVEGFDHALHGCEPALDDAADVDLLLRQPVALRQVDARDLEEVDPLVADRGIPHRGVEQAVQQRLPEHRLVANRLRQRQAVRLRRRRHERRRVDLGEPERDEHVLDATAQALERRECAEHGPPHRQRERNLVQPDAGDLLDQVDLASHVAAPPRRHRHVPVDVDVEAEAAQDRALLVRGSLEPDQLVGALRPEAEDGPCRQLPLDVALAQPACARQLDEKLRRERRSLRGEIRIDALLPAIRALGPQL